VVSFAALITFLSCKIYTSFPCLKFEMDLMPAPCLNFSLYAAIENLCEGLKNRFVLAVVSPYQSDQLLEAQVIKLVQKSLFHLPCFSWPKALGGLQLDDQGKVFWARPDELTSSTVSDYVSFGSSSGVMSQGSEVEAVVTATSRRRGRPRKHETPQVESLVKRSLRINS
jgi:hypothetical protein